MALANPARYPEWREEEAYILTYQQQEYGGASWRDWYYLYPSAKAAENAALTLPANTRCIRISKVMPVKTSPTWCV